MKGLSRRDWLAALAAWTAWRLAGREARADGPAWPVRVSSGPFHCASEAPLGGIANLFDELASLQRELTRTLALPAAQTPIEVLIFATENSHRSYLQRHFPRVPYRRALYVQRGGNGAVFAYMHPELTIDLRHECTHALMHAELAMVPLWLDEGLAEYFEVAATERAFGHPHLPRLRWDLRLGRGRSLESLENQHDLAAMGATEYRFAWAWVHFMLHGPQPAHQQLVDYLGDIRRGNPPGRLSERLRSAVPQLEQKMASHFRQWQSRSHA
jgi:hypothetical protein